MIDSHRFPGSRIWTTFVDSTRRPIYGNDLVSLEGGLTADNSCGPLPNGWSVGLYGVYRVYYERRLCVWGLAMGLDPDDPVDGPFNRKFMNHAWGLLHRGHVRVVADDGRPIPVVVKRTPIPVMTDDLFQFSALFQRELNRRASEFLLDSILYGNGRSAT